ncbi:nuclear transport factor 2 family protein [Nonomuraea thailandensis]
MNLVDRYTACWNETDPEARAKAVAELWTEDATYTDPLADVAGHAGIAAVIEGAQGMFPGLVFTAGDLYDAHHHTARFTWHLGRRAGSRSRSGSTWSSWPRTAGSARSSASWTRSPPPERPAHDGPPEIRRAIAVPRENDLPNTPPLTDNCTSCYLP